MPITKIDFITRLFVEAGIHEGMRILDVGCGSGDVDPVIEVQYVSRP